MDGVIAREFPFFVRTYRENNFLAATTFIGNSRVRYRSANISINQRGRGGKRRGPWQ